MARNFSHIAAKQKANDKLEQLIYTVERYLGYLEMPGISRHLSVLPKVCWHTQNTYGHPGQQQGQQYDP